MTTFDDTTIDPNNIDGTRLIRSKNCDISNAFVTKMYVILVPNNGKYEIIHCSEQALVNDFEYVPRDQKPKVGTAMIDDMSSDMWSKWDASSQKALVSDCNPDATEQPILESNRCTNKPCIECKHYCDPNMCKAKKVENYVTGAYETVVTSADEQRKGGKYNCGPSGMWFERKG